jgi:hypothetical protein
MPQYSVERIIGRRASKKGMGSSNKDQNEYLVKWVGYSIEESTWEPLRNLTYVMSMVKEFDKLHDKKGDKKEAAQSNSKSSKK